MTRVCATSQLLNARYDTRYSGPFANVLIITQQEFVCKTQPMSRYQLDFPAMWFLVFSQRVIAAASQISPLFFLSLFFFVFNFAILVCLVTLYGEYT